MFIKRRANICPHTDSHTDVHRSFMHSSPNEKTARCPSAGEKTDRGTSVRWASLSEIKEANDLQIQATPWMNKNKQT